MRQRLRGLIKKQKDQIQSVQKKHQESLFRYKKAESRLDGDPFNTNLVQVARIHRGKKNANRDLLESLKKSQQIYKAQELEVDKALRSLTTSFNGVLAIQKIQTTNLGYPFKIVYKRKCPKFQDGCPLTQVEKQAMKKILQSKLVKPIKVCERYMNQAEY